MAAALDKRADRRAVRILVFLIWPPVGGPEPKHRDQSILLSAKVETPACPSVVIVEFANQLLVLNESPAFPVGNPPLSVVGKEVGNDARQRAGEPPFLVLAHLVMANENRCVG